jgi:hypothetical protein
MPSLADTVEALLWEDESTVLDFKEVQYPLANEEEKAEFIKDLLAFANAFRRDDAYILLGVKDVKGGRGIITGVTCHLEDAHLQQLVNSKTNRTLEFSYHALEVDGKRVGSIRIPRQSRPTYLKKNYGKLRANTVYIRHGSSTSIATPDEIARMGTHERGTTATQSPEIAALTNVLHHTRFYERIITLIEDISNIPHHRITNIAKPPEYEEERRSLHVAYNADHHRFEQILHSARDLLTVQQARVPPADATEIAEILAAMRDVERSVATLGAWANERLQLVERSSIPWDKQHDAEEAAANLSTLVARRLLTLGAPPP